MIKIISFSVLTAIVLCCSPMVASDVPKSRSISDESTFATNECFAKGGLGIVNQKLYIVLRSNENELALGTGGRDKWTGHNVTVPEVVIFFKSRIWLPGALPVGFDMSKAVVVSFEDAKIRFFDFTKMSGGYYKRELLPSD